MPCQVSLDKVNMTPEASITKVLHTRSEYDMANLVMSVVLVLVTIRIQKSTEMDVTERLTTLYIAVKKMAQLSRLPDLVPTRLNLLVLRRLMLHQHIALEYVIAIGNQITRRLLTPTHYLHS